jgi:hypothetical protein
MPADRRTKKKKRETAGASPVEWISIPLYRMADNRMPGIYTQLATAGDEKDPTAMVGFAMNGSALYIFLSKEPHGKRGAAPVVIIRTEDIIAKALEVLAGTFPSLAAALATPEPPR